MNILMGWGVLEVVLLLLALTSGGVGILWQRCREWREVREADAFLAASLFALGDWLWKAWDDLVVWSREGEPE